jgi:hypothetical protein
VMVVGVSDAVTEESVSAVGFSHKTVAALLGA